MTASRWTPFAVTALALLLASPRLARAAASARLLYVRGPGAETCPGEPAIRAAVRARLGYDPFFAWARDTLYARIEREGPAFRAIVQLVDDQNRQRGAREISVQGTDCTPVVDAVGLTVSLTLDPSSVLGARPTPATPAPAPDPTAPPDPTPPPAQDPTPPPVASAPPAADSGPTPSELPARAPTTQDDALAWRVGVGAIASLDAASSPTAGATVTLGAAWRRLSLDLEWRGDFPAGGAGANDVRSWLIVGAIVPCVHVAFAFACPVFSAGAIGATAPRAVHAAESYGPWAAAGGRLGAAWEIAPRFTLGAYVEALATLVRDNFQVDKSLENQVAPWSGGLGAGASWRFQ